MATGISENMALIIARQAGVFDNPAEILARVAPIARMDGAPFYDPIAVSRAVAYATGLQRQAELEAESAAASAAWRAIDGVGSGPSGLTPDSVKFGSEYQRARARYEAAAAQLRRFNARFCSKFAAELRADRKARRERAAA